MDKKSNFLAQAESTYFNQEDLPSNLQKLIEENIHLVSIDRGFGGTKILSANGKHMFSSYVSKIDNDNVHLTNPKDILIKLDNNIYRVGDEIRNQIKNSFDTSGVNLIYNTKELLESKEYLISNMAALALSLVNDPNEFLDPTPLVFNKEILLVMGLPISETTSENISKIIEVIGDISKFYIRTNNSPLWKEIKVNINKKNIEVTGQPLGTLQSLVRTIDGNFSDKAEELYSSEEGQVLILDGGYGTFDTVILNSGMVINGDTWSNCAMQSILKETTNSIHEELVAAGQTNASHLSTIGIERTLVKCFDSNKPYIHREKQKNINFVIDDVEDLFNRATKSNAAIVTNNITQNYGDYETLRIVLTGGTTKLMQPYLEKYCNENYIKYFWSEEYGYEDEIYNFDSVFANVYGYYSQKIASIFAEKGWVLLSDYYEEDEIGEVEVEVIEEEKAPKTKSQATKEVAVDEDNSETTKKTKTTRK